MDSQLKTPLIVIVGPTASGKTSVAIELAEQYNGEIICADSRTVYRGLDIGTAKPSREERSRVPHWGLDLVNPGERFTVADFKRYSDSKIADIRRRGKVPFLVGGSGLYVDAVVFNFRLGGEADEIKREYLDGLDINELHNYCKVHNIELPENSANKRYIIRAIERSGLIIKRELQPADRTFVVGIATNKQVLRKRIIDRSEQLFSQSVVNEAKTLGKKYGWDSEAMTGNIYPLIQSYLDKEKTMEEIKEKFTSVDWALAKRQLTWFRGNPHIIWFSKDEVSIYIREVLAVR